MKFSTKTLMMFAMIGAGSAMISADPMDSEMDNLGLDVEGPNDEESSAGMDALNRLRGRGLEAKRKVCFKFDHNDYDFPLYSIKNFSESQIAVETEKGRIVSDEECEANIGKSSRSKVCRYYTDKNYDAKLYARPNWTVQQVKQYTAKGQVVDDEECKKNIDTRTTEYCFNSAKPTAPEWYRKQKLSNNDFVKHTTRKAYQTEMEDMSVCAEKLKKTKYCYTQPPKEKEKSVRPEMIYAAPNWDKQTYEKVLREIEAGKYKREMVPVEECTVKTRYCVNYGKDGLENLKERDWTKTSWSHKNNFPKVVDMQLCEDKKKEEADRKAAAIKVCPLFCVVIAVLSCLAVWICLSYFY